MKKRTLRGCSSEFYLHSKFHISCSIWKWRERHTSRHIQQCLSSPCCLPSIGKLFFVSSKLSSDFFFFPPSSSLPYLQRRPIICLKALSSLLGKQLPEARKRERESERVANHFFKIENSLSQGLIYGGNSFQNGLHRTLSEKGAMLGCEEQANE